MKVLKDNLLYETVELYEIVKLDSSIIKHTSN